MAKKQKTPVRVGKIDLDTCGAAQFLGLGIRMSDGECEVQVVDGEATAEDLADPEVFCIEVGGSGQTQLNNWDHHGPEAERLELLSATMQVALSMCDVVAEEERLSPVFNDTERNLVRYINQLDTLGPQAFGPRQEGIFPTLSDVFAGMLLVKRDPVKQLAEGMEIFSNIICFEIDPYGRMPIEGNKIWQNYAKAKTDNNRQVRLAVEGAQWGTTSSGLKLALIETDFFGAPGALYGVGAQVVVAFSPRFGPAKVPKFTIAGNGIPVDTVISELNAREPGWGGPPGGTIIGSPREGSKLTIGDVFEIVRRL